MKPTETEETGRIKRHSKTQTATLILREFSTHRKKGIKVQEWVKVFGSIC